MTTLLGVTFILDLLCKDYINLLQNHMLETPK